MAVAAGLGLWFQNLYRNTDDAPWLWASVAAALLGAVSVTAFRIWDERRDTKAIEHYQLRLADGLEPLLQQLVKLAEANSKPLQNKRLAELGRCSIEAATHLIGANRVRATYYRLRHTSKSRFELVPEGGHTGRSTPAQTIFRNKTPEGDYVFKEFGQNRSIIVLDTAECKLPGWDCERERDYRTFISVPVRGPKELFGMLTVDAPEVGDLTVYDEKLIRSVALLLASGIAMVLTNEPKDEKRRL